uniref:Uncharacterized protein n=1 Tax=Anguilla anguilla TaxID=7936 RepID=A0A0E9RB93_ANGAN
MFQGILKNRNTETN